ncbi:MAG: NAD(P)H-dependent oxidoreductase [Polaromonas sp.]|nr:NAD(P)H-dependent oxidoreductase [Polaromonas sp.]
MTKLLHVDSSILGGNSVSRQLTAQIVASWRAANPGTEVSYLDLAANTPSHLSAESLGFRMPADAVLSDAQKRENVVSEALVSQFLAADVIVASARGGVYSTSEAMTALEHQESYLKVVFGFFGITDVRFVRAEGLAMGEAAKAAALAAAEIEIVTHTQPSANQAKAALAA